MEEPQLRDYYGDLGVSLDSNPQQIKKAFHKLAILHHPDKTGPGGSNNSEEFRKAREAQETLCDEEKRLQYDRQYSRIREEWARYREMQEARRIEEVRAAEEAARRMAEAEKARRVEEEERQATERAEQERLREYKERKAEERSREAARRAREQQEQAAKQRLREHMETEAEARSLEVAKKARERQEIAAKGRLAESKIIERQDALRRNWAQMKERAESQPKLVENDDKMDLECVHPQIGWPRKNGPVLCYFCGSICPKFSFRCPYCDAAACTLCKKQHCLY